MKKLSTEIEQLYLQLCQQCNLWRSSWDEVADQLTCSILQTIPAQQVRIWQLGDSGQHLTPRDITNNTDTPNMTSLSISDNAGYLNSLNQDAELTVSDIQANAALQKLLPNSSQHPKHQSALHIPLKQREQIVGLLCIDFLPTNYQLSAYQQHYLAAVANILCQCLCHERLRQSELNQHKVNQNLMATFDNAGECIFLMRGEFFVDCNQAALSLFECTKEQILNHTPIHFSPEYQPDGQLSKNKSLSKINAAFNGQTQCFEWQHKKYDGTLFDAEVTLTMIKINGEETVHAIVRDISERKLAEQQIQQSKSLLLAQNKNLTLINKLTTELHGCTSVDTIVNETLNVLLELLNTPYIAIFLVDKEAQNLLLTKSHGFSQKMISVGSALPLSDGLNAKALKVGHPVVSSDISNDEDANPQLQKLLDASGVNSGAFIPLIYQQKPLGTMCFLYEKNYRFSDTELDTFETIGKNMSLSIVHAQHLNKMEFMAHHDSLTGLPNRALLHREFENNIASGPGMPAVLLLIDLDRFKDINDTLGHYVGDLLLQQISPRISQCTEKYKTLICRLGGDEFTVLIYGTPDKQEVIALTDKILTNLRQPINIDSMLLEIDASIGVAFYPANGKDSHALLRSADVAMYEAKRRGGGASIYNQAKDIHTPERLTLMAELGSAIRDDQLVLHYQPKVDLKSNKVIGFEALVRWNHFFSGLLYPDKFIPLAEVSDAIHHLTEKVLDMALSQQQKWRQAGHHFSVAVNLSARNLVDERCVNNLKNMLDKYQTPAGMLELEITETALMQDPEKAVDLLNQLSAQGIKLSIDDFGTGYSSLSYLRQLPIDTLKIDRYFVNEMLKNEQDIIIVRSTISLGHNLNLKVIAEGVEDQATLAALRKMNCDIAQGYYISKPQDWSEIENWLTQW